MIQDGLLQQEMLLLLILRCEIKPIQNLHSAQVLCELMHMQGR